MLRAVLICSDDECTEVYEAFGSLAEIEALACECGCGLAMVGWPEEDASAERSATGVELIPL